MDTGRFLFTENNPPKSTFLVSNSNEVVFNYILKDTDISTTKYLWENSIEYLLFVTKVFPSRAPIVFTNIVAIVAMLQQLYIVAVCSSDMCPLYMRKKLGHSS